MRVQNEMLDKTCVCVYVSVPDLKRPPARQVGLFILFIALFHINDPF